MSEGIRGSTSTAVLLLLLSVVVAGCAGTEIAVVANGTLNGPASLTDTVFDSRGRSLEVGEGLEKIGELHESERFWALITFAQFSGDEWDVTDLVNEALAKNGGDAILNLVVETNGCFYLPIATLIPIIPSYIDVRIHGDIVRAVGPQVGTP